MTKIKRFKRVAEQEYGGPGDGFVVGVDWHKAESEVCVDFDQWLNPEYKLLSIHRNRVQGRDPLESWVTLDVIYQEVSI